MMKTGSVALLVLVSTMISGCLADDKGASPSPSPTPSGGMNNTSSKPTDLTITAYDTPAPGQMTLMRLDPKTLSGKVNQSVNIIFKVAAGQRSAHNLRITELGVSLDGVAAGAMKNVTITLAKTGTFKYYCNLNPGTTAQTSHDSLGMNGQLTVS